MTGIRLFGHTHERFYHDYFINAKRIVAITDTTHIYEIYDIDSE